MAEFDIGDIFTDIFADTRDINSADFKNDLSDYNESVDEAKQIIINEGVMTIGSTKFDIIIDGKQYEKVPDMQEAMKEYKTKLATDATNSLEDTDDVIGDRVQKLTESICGGDCSEKQVSKIRDGLLEKIEIEKSRILPDAKAFVDDPKVIDDFKNNPTAENGTKVVESICEKQGITSEELNKKINSQTNELKSYIDDKINKSTDLVEKSRWEKFLDFMGDNWGKITVVTLGAILTALYTLVYKNENSGCFVTKSDPKQNISKCKYLAFTCLSDYKTQGSADCTDFTNYICDQKKNPKCTTNDACQGDDSGDISKKCSNDYMQTTVGGNTYDYQSIVCDFECAMGSIVKGIAEIVKEVVDAGKQVYTDFMSIFDTILKNFIYIAIGIAILMVVFYVYKYMSGKKDGNPNDINIKVSTDK